MRTITFTAILLLFLVNVSGQPGKARLRISHLTGDFYIFTTDHLYKGFSVPANGMYVLTGKGVVMFDTPWDTTQFQPLLDSIAVKHHQKVIMCLATHFHEDRTGGLEYYRQQGIKTYTTRKTDSISKERGMKRAEYLMDNDTVFTIGKYSFQTYFPGEGHTKDNIIVWFAKEKILYGGCLVKSIDDDSLGNLSDATVKDYAATIQHVEEKCKNPLFIITGHNNWKSTRSLSHTFNMAQRLQKTGK